MYSTQGGFICLEQTSKRARSNLSKELNSLEFERKRFRKQKEIRATSVFRCRSNKSEQLFPAFEAEKNSFEIRQIPLLLSGEDLQDFYGRPALFQFLAYLCCIYLYVYYFCTESHLFFPSSPFSTVRSNIKTGLRLHTQISKQNNCILSFSFSEQTLPLFCSHSNFQNSNDSGAQPHKKSTQRFRGTSRAPLRLENFWLLFYFFLLVQRALRRSSTYWWPAEVLKRMKDLQKVFFIKETLPSYYYVQRTFRGSRKSSKGSSEAMI